MKLCRFETVDEPGNARSGFAYEGRIIETDGTQPIATYEGSQVRLLAPIGRPNSVRLFYEKRDGFLYVHPATVFGPNQTLALTQPDRRLDYLPCLAVVLVGGGFQVPPNRADDLVMGLAFAFVFRHEGLEGAASYDAGIALGPALCTPDEFEGGSIRPAEGAAYGDQVTLLQNSVDAARFDLSAMGRTVAQAVSHASQTLPVGEGDLLLLPLGEPDVPVEPGDELRLTSPRIGTLIVRVGR